jgi:hypothetical protein
MTSDQEQQLDAGDGIEPHPNTTRALESLSRESNASMQGILADDARILSLDPKLVYFDPGAMRWKWLETTIAKRQAKLDAAAKAAGESSGPAGTASPSETPVESEIPAA